MKLIIASFLLVKPSCENQKGMTQKPNQLIFIA